MIVSNRTGPFGSKIALIEVGDLQVTVSTAKEGLFKGLSTMIILGGPSSRRAIAKVIHRSELSGIQRREVHDDIAAKLDTAIASGSDLLTAVSEAVVTLAADGAIADFFSDSDFIQSWPHDG